MLVSIILITLLAAAGVFIYQLHVSNKESGLPLSNIIITYFRGSFPGAYLILLAVITFGECMVAATVHKQGVDRIEINIMARIAIHLSFGFFQFISGLGIASAFQQIMLAIKEKSVRDAVLSLIMLCGFFIGVVFVPYINLTILASSLGELSGLHFLFYSLWDWVPFSGVGEIQIRARALSLGLPQTVTPDQLISAPLILMCATIGIHIIITLIQAAFSLYIDTRVGVVKNEYPEDVNEEEEEEEETENDPVGSDSDDVKSPLEKMLRFYDSSIYTGRVLLTTITKAMNSIKKIEDHGDWDKVGAIATKIAEFKMRIESVNASDEDEVTELKNQIFEFISGDVQNGGLGVPLQ